MAKVMAILKGYGLIILCVLVVLAAPAAGFFFGHSMNASVRAEQADEASSELRRINGAEVTYRVPGVSPEDRGVELRSAPNPKLTEWFAARRAEVFEQVERAREEIVAFNRRDHEPLVDGLLPEPASDQEGRVRGFDFIDRLLGTRDTPSAYEDLLDTVRAGSPMPPAELLPRLQEERQTIIDEFVAQRGPGPLDEEEEAEKRERLSKARINEYRGRARTSSVYAEIDAIGRGQGTRLRPTTRPTNPPTPAEVFGRTFDFWVLEDLFAAIRLANSTAGGGPTRLDDSAIKRIDAVRLEPFSAGSEESAGGRVDRTSRFGAESSSTLTGRSASDGSSVYDLRYADLELVVDSSQIDAVLESFGRTNLMTVIGMEVESVDPWEELRDGYYWGDAHVVKLILRIETLWLRAWTSRFMPDEIADALGVQRPERDEA